MTANVSKHEEISITKKDIREFCLNVCKYKPAERYFDASCQLPKGVGCPLYSFISHLLNPLKQKESDWIPSPFGDS